MSIQNLREILKQQANPVQAKIYLRFFKTGKGEYGEGDEFLGIKVPVSKKIAKQFKDLTLKEIKTLIDSKLHEERLIALFILTGQYIKGDEEKKKIIFNFYIKNINRVNNWDLVDLSAEKIIGAYLFEKNKDLLFEFARSKSLWERRIAIMSTFHFIKNDFYDMTFEIAELLLKDKHDLIHKAVGWMLREIGKRNLVKEEKFLKKHYKIMPRTMLRYAIEKFPEVKRQLYLRGRVKNS